jgi:hypothetical protein
VMPYFPAPRAQSALVGHNLSVVTVCFPARRFDAGVRIPQVPTTV